MGNFLAWKRNQPLPNSVLEVFRKRGFQHVHEAVIGDYHLAFAEKQLLRYPCFHQEAAFSLLVMGSVIIPKTLPMHNLDLFVSHYKMHGGIDTSDVSGNFLIVIFENNQVRFFTDAANGYSLYFHSSGIWSDSQLALVHALHASGEPTTWDARQVSTNLCLGFLYGENTIYKNVLRFDSTLHNAANDWKFMRPSRNIMASVTPPVNTIEAVDLQRETLMKWFQDMSPALSQNGLLCGITGGLDSRLLAVCSKTLSSEVKIQAFTNTQSTNNEQVQIAREVSKALDIDFKEVLLQGNCSDIQSNLYYNDGILRIYQIWLEESKSRAYSEMLFTKGAILLTGVGGEQYRNSTFTSSVSVDFKSWFKIEYVRKISGNSFKLKVSETNMLNELDAYVRLKLDRSQGDAWSRADIEGFLHRIFNPAVRLVRNNIENQLGITLSPFTEAAPVVAAELAEPFSRQHLSFEVDLIRAFSNACNDIRLDYGFKLSEQIPLKYRGRMLFQRWMPGRIRGIFYSLPLLRKRKEPVELMKLPNASDAIRAVRSMRLDVDVDVLLQNPLLSPLVFEMGFLILALDGVVLRDDSTH